MAESKSSPSLSLSDRLKVLAVSATIVMGLVVFAVSQFLIVIQPGTVAVPVVFGEVSASTKSEGMHLVNPLARYPRMDIRRQIIEISSGGGAQTATGGGEIVALSRDQLPLSIDIGFPFSLNPAAAWKVYQRIGDDATYRDQLLRPAARSAVRDAVAQFSWDEAAATRREQLAETILGRLIQLTRAELEQLGFTAEDAGSAFTILPVQLRRVLPPQQIQDAVAEKLRAEQDLQRQVTLAEITRLEAERREYEELGVAKLFSQLPQGFTPEQIAVVLNALANKRRADAVVRAAESDRVGTIIFEGGGQGAIPIAPEPR